MVKKIKQFILVAIYKLENEEKHGILVYNTKTETLVIQEDSCLNIPADLKFDHRLETVSYFDSKLKMFTLIFNDRS